MVRFMLVTFFFYKKKNHSTVYEYKMEKKKIKLRKEIKGNIKNVKQKAKKG